MDVTGPGSPTGTGGAVARVLVLDDDPLVRRALAYDRRTAAREALGALTEREQEVALAVARGLPNAQIAEELYMSPATVKAYVSRLLARLGVDNRVQVTLLVHDAGLTG